MNGAMDTAEPSVIRVSGPVVTAEGMAGAQMYEVVHVDVHVLVTDGVKV